MAIQMARFDLSPAHGRPCPTQDDYILSPLSKNQCESTKINRKKQRSGHINGFVNDKETPAKIIIT